MCAAGITLPELRASLRLIDAAKWTLLAVLVLEIVGVSYWTWDLSSRIGAEYLLDVVIGSVLPLCLLSLLPTVVALPLVVSTKGILEQGALSGMLDLVSRARRRLAVLGAVTLLSLVVPGILLIIAFFKSEKIELALASRQYPVYLAYPPRPA